MATIYDIAERRMRNGVSRLKPHTKTFLEQIVETPMLEIGLDAIERSHKTALQGDDTAVGCFLTGPSGSGKSKIVKTYRAMFPPQKGEISTIQPVIYASLKPKTSVKGIYSAFLEALGDPAPTAGTEAIMEQRVTTLMKNTGVELMFLDEIQHVLPGHVTAKTTTQQAADLLKSLIDKTQVPIVCVGLDESERLLHAQITPDNQQDQLKRRNRETVLIYPPDRYDEDWSQMAAGYQEALQFQCVSLTTPDMLDRLYLATGGLHGSLNNLFREALELVSPGEQIDKTVLGPAYLGANSCPSPFFDNPFEMTVKEVEKAFAAIDAASEGRAAA